MEIRFIDSADELAFLTSALFYNHAVTDAAAGGGRSSARRKEPETRIEA